MTEKSMGQFSLGARDFSLLHSVHTDSGVSCLPSDGYQELFPWRLCGQGKKLIPHFHLAARLN